VRVWCGYHNRGFSRTAAGISRNQGRGHTTRARLKSGAISSKMLARSHPRRDLRPTGRSPRPFAVASDERELIQSGYLEASEARPRHTSAAQIRRDIIEDVSQITPAPRSSPYRPITATARRTVNARELIQSGCSEASGRGYATRARLKSGAILPKDVSQITPAPRSSPYRSITAALRRTALLTKRANRHLRRGSGR
jgi:hypothetical protein